jgi:MFS family permease
LRFLLGAADGALLPAVQTLLVYNSTSQVAGRIFSYNQSFRDIGNVTGPLIGASVSASYGFRAVFLSPRRSSCSTLSIPPSACGALPVMNRAERGLGRPFGKLSSTASPSLTQRSPPSID